MLPTLKENVEYEIKFIEVDDILVGDIIVFYINRTIICHRVTKKMVSLNGSCFFETKGV